MSEQVARVTFCGVRANRLRGLLELPHLWLAISKILRILC